MLGKRRRKILSTLKSFISIPIIQSKFQVLGSIMLASMELAAMFPAAQLWSAISTRGTGTLPVSRILESVANPPPGKPVDVDPWMTAVSSSRDGPVVGWSPSGFW